MKLSIKETVRFRPTAEGKTVYWNLYRQPINMDANGWASMSLEQIMFVFGNHVGTCGGGLPFDPEIEIEVR